MLISSPVPFREASLDLQEHQNSKRRSPSSSMTYYLPAPPGVHRDSILSYGFPCSRVPLFKFFHGCFNRVSGSKGEVKVCLSCNPEEFTHKPTW